LGRLTPAAAAARNEFAGPCPAHREADETATDRLEAVDTPGIPDEFEANAESSKDPGRSLSMTGGGQ
jgi:hypothetical protein